MAGLRLADDVLVDRYHRGAVVLVAGSTFALPEAAVCLIERIQRRAGTYPALDARERALAAELMKRGILIEDET